MKRIFIIGLMISLMLAVTSGFTKTTKKTPAPAKSAKVAADTTKSSLTSSPAVKPADVKKVEPAKDTTATISGDTTLPGKITLKWRTESERDNYGFNVFRGVSKDGPWTKVNVEVIPGHGESSEPHDYKFVDESVKKFTQYFYKLVEIDLAGNSKDIGLIKGMDKKAPEAPVIKEEKKK